MKVYVVLDETKSSYDAGGIYVGVYPSFEDAEKSLALYDKADRSCFSIEEDEL